MTIQRFQGIVLRLGNQMFVRHYPWINYPEDPQLMGIQFSGIAAKARQQRSRSCECGTCPKCVHRESVRTNRPKAADSFHRLHEELKGSGFSRRDDGIWIVDRTPEIDPPCIYKRCSACGEHHGPHGGVCQ